MNRQTPIVRGAENESAILIARLRITLLSEGETSETSLKLSAIGISSQSFFSDF